MTKTWRVYMYTFPNGKRYIGATSRTLSARQGKNWERYRLCEKLWSAIQEFGTQSIEQTILFKGEISEEVAAALERKYISKYDTANPNAGYNDGVGGEGLYSRNLSESRKAQLREQMRQIHAENVGRKVSDETRQKQRLAKLGTKRGPMSAETKAKIARANSLENISAETRARKSASKQKAVIAIEKDTGEQIVFESGEEAAKHFGVRPSSVSRWIKGTRKPHVNYTFQFSTNND